MRSDDGASRCRQSGGGVLSAAVMVRADLEGLALLRDHRRYRTEAHDLAEEDPGKRGES